MHIEFWGQKNLPKVLQYFCEVNKITSFKTHLKKLKVVIFLKTLQKLINNFFLKKNGFMNLNLKY
jgi:hypothetical protein